MNTPLVATLQELLRTGEKLIPQGGSESSGYNAKRQSKYLLWRKKSLDAIGVLREHGTLLFSRIVNDENGLYFYQSSAQKITAAVKEALQLAMYAPEPAPQPERKPAPRTPAIAVPPASPAVKTAVQTVTASAPSVVKNVVETVAASAPSVVENAVKTPSVDIPATVEAAVETVTASVPSVVKNVVETVAASAPPVAANTVEIPPEDVPATVETAVETVTASAPSVVANKVETLIADDQLIESTTASPADREPEPAPVNSGNGNGASLVVAGSSDQPEIASDGVDGASADADIASEGSEDAAVTDGDEVAIEDEHAAEITPVAVFASAAHPSLAALQHFFTELSIDCTLFTHAEGSWESLSTLNSHRPLPRYAVFLLSEKYREEELMALGYLAGKYPWLMISCVHHSAVTLPTLLPGITSREFTHALDEIQFGVMKELKLAGYSVSL